jgi:hypothetical protein
VTDTHSQQDAPDLAALLRRILEEYPEETQKRWSDESGIPRATINAWATRRRGTGGRIDPEHLRALHKVLPKGSTTLKELFEASGRRAPGPVDEEREKTLLSIYRNLPPAGQRALLQMAEALRSGAVGA